MPYCDFHFLRHLPVTTSLRGRVYGRGPLELDRTSPEVTKRLDFLAATLPHKDVTVHVSPTPRTHETFNALVELDDRFAGLPAQEDSAFIEQHWGEFTDVSLQDLVSDHPLKDRFSQCVSDPAGCAAPGGESYKDVYVRVSDRMQTMAQKLLSGEKGDYIIATHSVPMRAAAAFAFGIPGDTYLNEIVLSPLSHLVLRAEAKTDRQKGLSVGWSLQSLTQGIPTAPVLS